MNVNRFFGGIITILLILRGPASAEVKRVKFSGPDKYLIVEVLKDNLIHLEVSASAPGPRESEALSTSPMVFKTDYEGPVSFRKEGNLLETSALLVRVDPRNLCAAFQEKAGGRELTVICPVDLERDWKGLTVSRNLIKNVYGLGQQFKKLGSADGDWLRHGVREEQPAGQWQAHGNGFMPFGQAGMVGNVQFPVMYALGENINYALFIDNVYKQRWDFSDDPWQIHMWGDQIRFYVIAGPDLPHLRAHYMELAGRPPVPPRKAFGLWVSEFGYQDWQQIDKLRAGLRRDNFPVDGFVLDLQWFGGVVANSPDSKMGTLDWDAVHFPGPDANLAYFKNDDIGFVAIEESYVNEKTDTFAPMRAGDFFAYKKTDGRCSPLSRDPVSLTDWFGKAAMIDWSNPEAGTWVHENRRFPNLVRKGVLGHWTDLGEPEKYDPAACYNGVEATPAGPKNQHGDVHNLYAFLWNKSIYDGYYQKRDMIDRRPFMLSRSGAPGINRFGAAMWSGDIGSNLDLLGTHLNAQMHMSFSGIDYFGSDIGGFRREGMPYNGGHSGNLHYQNELYTQWFANGAWFDVPVRPHTDNSFQTSKRYETAPNLVGDIRSNRENLRQRYELIPYYYSLAHRAHLQGEPLMPPLVYYYQDDPAVRELGHEKLIGRDVLVAAAASHGEMKRNVYLPKGKWVNYHTREWFNSAGQWINDFPLYVDGVFRLPVFAKAGAILPLMRVDEQTKDAFGRRKDGTGRDDLLVKVYADSSPSRFTLYEDDGTSIAYDERKNPLYRVRTTVISQKQNNNEATIVIDKATGGYSGALRQRNNLLRLVVNDARAVKITLNGKRLVQRRSAAEFDRNGAGWRNAGPNLIEIKSGTGNVNTRKTFKVTLQSIPPAASAYFICDNGWTALGENIYIVGNQPQLGKWDPNKGIKLDPSVYFEYIYNPPLNHNGPGPKTPKWTGFVRGLPSNASVEWKCVKKLSSGEWVYSPGNNGVLNLPASGFAGTTMGSF